MVMAQYQSISSISGDDPGEVEEDFAITMQRQNAIFGYTHVGREDPLNQQPFPFRLDR
jgi:hypothetical protein